MPTSLHILSLLILLTCSSPAIAQAPGESKLAPVTSPAELAQRIQTTLKDAELDGAKIGIHVVDLSSGAVLYAQGEQVPLNPASNIKLLTAGAALDLFGPSHTFSTKLIGPEPRATPSAAISC